MSEAGGDDDWVSEALAEGLFDRVEAPPPTHREPVTEPVTAHRASGPADEIPVAAERTQISPVAVFDQESSDGLATATGFDPEFSDVDPMSDDLVEADNAQAIVDDEPDQMESIARAVGEWIVVLVGAIAVALILRALLFQAFFIPSESMEATLLEDDRVLVNKVSYRLHDVNQGDVIVFRRPDDEPGEIRDLIKRVIGVPGQTVEGRENSVWINGQRLEESYLADDEVILDFGPVTVEAGQLFVMGDNRDESLDSRFFGTIDEERVVGRAFVIFWPVTRLGWL